MAESKREKIKRKIKENPMKAGLGAGALLGAGAGVLKNKRDFLGKQPLDIGPDIFNGGPNLRDKKILRDVIDHRAVKRVNKPAYKSALKGALGGAAFGGLIGNAERAAQEKTKEAALDDGLEKVAYASGIDKEVIAEIIKEAASTAPELEGVVAEHNESEENVDLSNFVSQIDGLTKEEAREILEQVRG